MEIPDLTIKKLANIQGFESQLVYFKIKNVITLLTNYIFKSLNRKEFGVLYKAFCENIKNYKEQLEANWKRSINEIIKTYNNYDYKKNGKKISKSFNVMNVFNGEWSNLKTKKLSKIADTIIIFEKIKVLKLVKHSFFYFEVNLSLQLLNVIFW
jgi:hypothetical protein